MKRLKWILLMVCLLCLNFLSEVSATPNFGSTLGVNHHFTQQTEQDAWDIRTTATAGFRIIRYDMTWEQVERVKGDYDFTPFDRLVTQMVAKGIRPLFILDYGNSLYGERAMRTEESRAAFARFAGAAAKRYQGKGVSWEIWNEPNTDRFWLPVSNPYEYMKLVIDAVTEMRWEDPDAYIIGPGVAGMDFPYLETLIKVGLLRYVDAVSIHPYRREAPETILPEYERLKQLIQQKQPQGKQIPIVVSELGYSAAAFRGDEQLQARYLSRMFLINTFAGVDFTIWYDFRNDGPDPREGEHNFGLLRQDGTPKATINAAQEMSRQLGGRIFARRLTSRPNDFLLEFMDGKSKSCVVAWTTGKAHATKVEGQGRVELTQTPQYFGCLAR